MNVPIADIVWPALFLTDRIVAIPVIAAGFVLEAAIFARVLQLSWRRAIGIAGAINLISALVGIAVLPTWGYYWDAFVSERNRSFGWGHSIL